MIIFTKWTVSILEMYDFDTGDTWIQHKIANLSQGLSTLNDYKTIICLLFQEFYCWHKVVTTEAILTQYGSKQTAHHPFVHPFLFIYFCQEHLAKRIQHIVIASLLKILVFTTKCNAKWYRGISFQCLSSLLATCKKKSHTIW